MGGTRTVAVAEMTIIQPARPDGRQAVSALPFTEAETLENVAQAGRMVQEFPAQQALPPGS